MAEKINWAQGTNSRKREESGASQEVDQQCRTNDLDEGRCRIAVTERVSKIFGLK